MKLFEATFRDGYEFYERYYDTELNRSMKSRIDLPYEWYEPSSRGLYTSILDETITLDKKQGRAKEGRDHYGFLDPMYRNIRDNYWNKNAYNMEPRVWQLDIETRVGTCSTGFPDPSKALEPISLFQFYDNKEDAIIVLGLRDWKHYEDYKFEVPCKYVKCNNEIHLIETFFSIFKRLDPLIIYAWNGLGFDFPYIYNRLKNLGMDVTMMSNYGSVSIQESEFQGKTEFKFSSDGHFYMDMMHVYKKFVLEPRPSYSLDTIAEIELGENKVSHAEYSSFDDFYTGDYNIPNNPTTSQRNSKIYQEAIKNGINDEVRELAHSEFCYYGYKDPLLIKKIDEKANLTNLMLMISEKMGVQVSDSLGTVKPWSQYIANRSLLDRKVLPPRQENKGEKVVGGFVREPIVGKHKWVLSEDVNSMYPLLSMVGFNMSPETFIPKYKLPDRLRDIVLQHYNNQDEDKRLALSDNVKIEVTSLLKEHNLSMAINGAAFSKDKLGTIPELVQELYNSRKEAKKTMFKYERRKVLIQEILSSK